MGQESSKIPPSSTQHVFSSETPVRFSQELIDALQSSPETDSTRAKDLELHIQSRVNAELSRLEAEQTKALKELEEQISASPPDSHQPSDQPNKSDSSSATCDTNAKGGKPQDLGRQSVQKEIETLRQRLSQRKLKEDIMNDKGVEKAKEDVVKCLRINDRRPLDCWQEVEVFKKEVGRLEKDFLGRVIQ
ncbi:hypothetical protein MMC14_001431 [Varicellaria rhodocarpa]|nr:hypothetical protein [Varicellaria rhodocarpa]